MGQEEDAFKGESRRRAKRTSVISFIWYKLLDSDLDAMVSGEGIAQIKTEGVAHSCDISRTGVGLYLAHPLPAEATVFIEVAGKKLNLSAIGKVVYSKKEKKGYYRVGLEFVVIPPNDLISLKKYVGKEESILVPWGEDKT